MLPVLQRYRGLSTFETESYEMESLIIMDIEPEFSGGYANIRLSYHGDTDKLPPETADKLLKLIERSRVFELQQSELAPTNAGPPDALHYKLTLHEGSKKKNH
jgi:hypothetical protein